MKKFCLITTWSWKKGLRRRLLMAEMNLPRPKKSIVSINKPQEARFPLSVTSSETRNALEIGFSNLNVSSNHSCDKIWSLLLS